MAENQNISVEESLGAAVMEAPIAQPEKQGGPGMPATGGPPKKMPARKKRKKLKTFIILFVVLIVVGAAVWGVLTLFNSEEESDILTEFTYIGGIQTKVSGSGPTVPLVSETLKAKFKCTVDQVLATVGQSVAEGDALYTLDLTELEKTYDEQLTALLTLRREHKALLRQPEALNEQIAAINEKLGGLSFRAPFAGKIIDIKVKTGDTVSVGTVLATLIDDNTMRLTQYFSYAYEQDIHVGDKAVISIPSGMSNIEGTVEKINYVERISAEGTRLFEVIFTMPNPGTLTEGVLASASVVGASGEMMTPYESAELKYKETRELTSEADGEVTSVRMLEYGKVSRGDSLVSIKNTTYAAELEGLQDQIDSMDEQIKASELKLEKKEAEVEEMRLLTEDNTFFSSIAGLVTNINVMPGQVVEIDGPIMTISESSVIIVEAQIDAMNVGNVTAGTSVEIVQYGMEGEEYFTGVVDSVSLEGKNENGYAYFPAKIRVDNPDGRLLSGNWVNFNIVASEVFDVVVAPIQSVKYTDVGSVVYVKGDAPDGVEVPDLGPSVDIPSGFYPVIVETGLSDNYSVEIISGLEPDMEVFTQYLTDQGSSFPMY